MCAGKLLSLIKKCFNPEGHRSEIANSTSHRKDSSSCQEDIKEHDSNRTCCVKYNSTYFCCYYTLQQDCHSSNKFMTEDHKVKCQMASSISTDHCGAECKEKGSAKLEVKSSLIKNYKHQQECGCFLHGNEKLRSHRRNCYTCIHEQENQHYHQCQHHHIQEGKPNNNNNNYSLSHTLQPILYECGKTCTITSCALVNKNKIKTAAPMAAKTVSATSCYGCYNNINKKSVNSVPHRCSSTSSSLSLFDSSPTSPLSKTSPSLCSADSDNIVTSATVTGLSMTNGSNSVGAFRFPPPFGDPVQHVSILNPKMMFCITIVQPAGFF